MYVVTINDILWSTSTRSLHVSKKDMHLQLGMLNKAAKVNIMK